MVHNRLALSHSNSFIYLCVFSILAIFMMLMLSYTDFVGTSSIYYLYLLIWCLYSFSLRTNVFIDAVCLMLMAWIDVVTQSVPGYLTAYFLGFMILHWYPVKPIHIITYYLLSIASIFLGAVLFFKCFY